MHMSSDEGSYTLRMYTVARARRTAAALIVVMSLQPTL